MKSKLLNTLGLAVAFSMVGLCIASDAAAYPDTSYRITYFSGPGPGATIVGKEVLACNGHYLAWGEETEWSYEETQDCNMDAN